MRIFIDEDESYPVYTMYTEKDEELSWGVEVDLPKEEIDFIREANARYKRAQSTLRKFYELGKE